jgi:hypothetical protein
MPQRACYRDSLKTNDDSIECMENIVSKRAKWAGHVGLMEECVLNYEMSVTKSPRCQDNIKIDIKIIWCDFVDWIEMEGNFLY